SGAITAFNTIPIPIISAAAPAVSWIPSTNALDTTCITFLGVERIIATIIPMIIEAINGSFQTNTSITGTSGLIKAIVRTFFSEERSAAGIAHAFLVFLLNFVA